jgi:thiol-disulfide isomerase/thioredoxin
MTDRSDGSSPRSRKRVLAIGAGVVVLAGVLTAGVIAAGGNGPAQANIPSATATAPTGTSVAAAAAPTGTGTPVAISGTDPVTGRAVSLATFTGKPVVLQIWASWCPGCNEEAPDLAEVIAARDDVHFVGLNYRDNAGDAKGFFAKYGLRYPNIEDRSGDIALGLGLQGTPTTVLLDAEHREVGRIVGATDRAGLDKAIDQLTGS